MPELEANSRRTKVSRHARRAEIAWDCVRALAPNGDRAAGNAKKLRTRSKELPTLLRQNGLELTLTFLEAKGTRDGHAQLLAWLGAIACGVGDVASEDGKADARVLVEAVLATRDAADYRRLVRAIDSAAWWLARLTEAHLGGGAESPIDQDEAAGLGAP